MNATFSRAATFGLPPKEFKAVLATADIKQVLRLRKYSPAEAAEADEDMKKKTSLVEKRLKELIAAGQLPQKRVPGTGERVETKKVYADTEENRQKGRVGKEYTTVKYLNSEFAAFKPRLKKKASNPANSSAPRRNLWLESVSEAKQQIAAPRFVVIRREGSDDDPGVQIYKLAISIMAEKKKQAEAAAAEMPESKTSP